jgi:hypothetical protein
LVRKKVLLEGYISHQRGLPIPSSNLDKIITRNSTRNWDGAILPTDQIKNSFKTSTSQFNNQSYGIVSHTSALQNHVKLFDETEANLAEEVEEEIPEEEIVDNEEEAGKFDLQEMEEEEKMIEEEEIEEEEIVNPLFENKITWEDCFQVWKGELNKQIIDQLPLYSQSSFPKFLFEEFVKSHGQDKAIEICKVLNKDAPTTVRINTLKISREEWMKNWSKLTNAQGEIFFLVVLILGKVKIPNVATECKVSPWGVTFSKREDLTSRPDFKLGFFEVQDEASQLVAYKLVNVNPGQHVTINTLKYLFLKGVRFLCWVRRKVTCICHKNE